MPEYRREVLNEDEQLQEFIDKEYNMTEYRDLAEVAIGSTICISGESEGVPDKYRKVIGKDLSSKRSCLQVSDNGGKHWVFNHSIKGVWNV